MIASYLQDVLNLQPNYSSTNTPEMELRGRLVRQSLPEELRRHLDALKGAQGVDIPDLVVQGKDGAGTKSEIPWVRLGSASLSPKATQGWYVVFLFSATGRSCFLTLGHASTTNVSESEEARVFRPLQPEVAEKLMHWGRERLGLVPGTHSRLQFSKNLEAKGELGQAYDRTGLCCFEYVSGSIPNDDVILADLSFLLALLTRLYAYEVADPTMPGSLTPEAQDALIAVNLAAGRPSSVRRKGGQGFGLSKMEKDVVEIYAVERAIKHLEALGYSEVRNVGTTHSYDLEVKDELGTLIVEVKGTTSHGESVLLTRNEVAIQREHYPRNALIVVSAISLERGASPIAKGGVIRSILPWMIDDRDLNPVGFEYQVPGDAEDQDRT